MTPEQAKQIVDTLANGIDPATGEVLPEDSCLNGPHVIRALVVAAKALELVSTKPARGTRSTPPNAGKAWDEVEDQRLLAAFDANTPIAALASAHERTRGAINARLMRLGRLQPSGAPNRASERRAENG